MPLPGGRSFCISGYRRAAGPSAAALVNTVAIVNGTRTVMVALQFKPSDAAAWRPDILNHRRSASRSRSPSMSGPPASSM